METTPSLNIDKVTYPEYQLYYEGIEQVLSKYEIDGEAFSHPKDKVIENAIRILNGYEIQPRFLEDPEKVLFALAIADSWDKDLPIEEKKALLTCFKLISVDSSDSGTNISTSDKILRLSDRENSSAELFDPSKPTLQKEMVKDVLNLMNTDTNIGLTADLQEQMRDMSDNGLLYGVRKRLGIQKEEPFEICVLNIKMQELIDKFGFPLMNLTIRNRKILILGSDVDYYYKSVQHEYIHSQSGRGLHRGYGGLLGRGLDEAFTESNTSTPETYQEQCRILDIIISKNQNYKALFRECYMQRDPDSKNLYKQLIKDYKLTGFLRLQRMSADADNIEGHTISRIFLKPEDLFPKPEEYLQEYDENGEIVF